MWTVWFRPAAWFPWQALDAFESLAEAERVGRASSMAGEYAVTRTGIRPRPEATPAGIVPART